MKKREIEFYLGKIKKQIHVGQISIVYLLKDGRILKIFNNEFIMIFKQIGYDIEKKILESEQYQIDPRIKKPTEILYANGIFCGYITERAKGISFNEIEDSYTKKDKENLYKYATLHNNLEKIIKESKEIVFPDLLTCDNIFIDKFQNIELIDFDGLQIGNNPVVQISTSLGSQEKIMSSKKYYNQHTKLFSKELDIKSLTHLYFLDAFNVDLSKVGMLNPYTRRIVTLDELFVLIRLENDDIRHKVWKLFRENETNEYLGEDIFEIAEKYTMTAIPSPVSKGMYFKQLKRK